MRIVLAVHHFPPQHRGGAELRACRTALALKQRGHHVRVVTVARIDDGLPGQISSTEDTYEQIEVHRLSFNLLGARDYSRLEYDNHWIGEYLRNRLARWRPDVFHLVGGYLITARPLAVAGELRIPTVVTLTDFWWLCSRISMLRSNGHLSTLPIDPCRCARCLGEERRRYRWPGRLAPGLMNMFWGLRRTQVRQFDERLDVLRRTLNQAQVISSPSLFVRSMYIEAGIAPERIVYCRQGRDLPDVRSETMAKSVSDRLRVGYLGQIAQVKGVHVLLEAMGRLPRLPLTIKVYGDVNAFPAYSHRLSRLAARDTRVEFLGVYVESELHQVLRGLDVVVVPSQWYENSPNVILEALACRTPVIASNLGGMAELIQHGRNGLLFEAGNASDLAAQLARLVEEPGLLDALRRGTGPVRSMDEEISELVGIYERAAGSRVASGASSLRR
jgi:glycosyltransferase involved in cell wall biosynthesis